MNKHLVSKLIITTLYISGVFLLAYNAHSNVFFGIMLCFMSKDLENVWKHIKENNNER